MNDELLKTKIECVLLRYGNELLDVYNWKIDKTIGEMIDPAVNEIINLFILLGNEDTIVKKIKGAGK
jgi:hypothetical protein